MALVLCPAGFDDARCIGEVSVEAWQSAYRGIMPDEYLDSLDADERATAWINALKAPPQKTKVILAADEERCVGFVAAGPCWSEPELGEVYALNVRPDVWRSGVGSTLLSTAARHLRDVGFGEAVLWVLPANSRARQFYERFGWGPDGVERDGEVFGLVVPEVRYRRSL